MLKKTIEFRDLDGKPLKEDFYFNITKAELAEMELSKKGGMKEYLEGIVASEDGAAIIAAFREIISISYGKRSEDGRSFIKTPELTKEFLGTDAYSELFMELVTDADAGSKFIRGVVPEGMSEPRKTIEVPLPARLDSPIIPAPAYHTDGSVALIDPLSIQDDLTLMSRAALIEQIRKGRTDK